MHVVLINQYYPPDTAPTGLMLEAVAAALAAAGHQATIVCAAGGGYAAGLAPAPTAAPPGQRVLRVGATAFGRATSAGKLLDYASFYLGVAWRLALLRPRPQRIVALTTPPYLSVLARVVSRLRRADHAHWVMDLYPDVMVAHGMLDRGSLRCRMLAALTRFGFGGPRCAAVVTLGPDMADRVAAYLPRGHSSPWVPLWPATNPHADDAGDSASNPTHDSPPDSARPDAGPPHPTQPPTPDALRARRGWAPGVLVLMYSGNLGLGHSFAEVLALARQAGAATPAPDLTYPAAPPAPRPAGPCRIVFFGGGRRRPEVEAFVRAHPRAPVELHGHVPLDQLAAHLASADVHLVSLRPEWDGTMAPSKLQGIFAAGRPVIFIGSTTGALGRWVLESGAGWVVPPGDVAALAAAVDQARDPAERDRRGAAARAFARAHFDRANNSRRVAGHLAGAVPPARRS